MSPSALAMPSDDRSSSQHLEWNLWEIMNHYNLRYSQIPQNMWDVCCFKTLSCDIISYALLSMLVFFRDRCIRMGRCQAFILLYHFYKANQTSRRLCPNYVKMVSTNTSQSLFWSFLMEKVSIPNILVRDKVCVKNLNLFMPWAISLTILEIFS